MPDADSNSNGAVVPFAARRTLIEILGLLASIATIWSLYDQLAKETTATEYFRARLEAVERNAPQAERRLRESLDHRQQELFAAQSRLRAAEDATTTCQRDKDQLTRDKATFVVRADDAEHRLSQCLSQVGLERPKILSTLNMERG